MAFKQKQLDAAGSTNATLLQAGATRVHTIMIMNASAATRYIRFYNKATSPTVGTDVPVCVIAVAATSSKEIALKYELEFPLGLGIAITTGAAYNDSGAATAHDVQMWIVYDNSLS